VSPSIGHAIKGLCVRAAAAIATLSPGLAQTPTVLRSTLDDIQFECRRHQGDDDLAVLTTMNLYAPIMTGSFPYRGYAIRMRADCTVEAMDRMVSWDEPRTLWHLRRHGPDQYVYVNGVRRSGFWNGTPWFRNAKGELLPPFFPVPDGPLGSHVSVAPAGPANFFLFYATRQTAIDQFKIDTEIAGFLTTGREVWRWSSRNDVPQAWFQTDKPVSVFDDRMHTNSVQVIKDMVVIGPRDLDAVLLVSLADGRLKEAIRKPDWTFVGDPAGGFSKAHTPHMTERGTLLMFDNGWTPGRTHPSRAVEYRLDFKARTATMIWEHKAAATYPSRNTMGSVVELPDGRRIIGWGAVDQTRVCRAGQMIQMFSIVRGDAVEREVMMPCSWSSYAIQPDMDLPQPKVSLGEVLRNATSSIRPSDPAGVMSR
jgi:hypothetical protein